MSNEPRREVFGRKVLLRTFVLSVITVLTGVVLDVAYVWIMGIIGMVVAGWKLKALAVHKREERKTVDGKGV